MRNLQLLIQHDEAEVAIRHLLHEGDAHVVQAFLCGQGLSLGALHSLAGLAPEVELPGGTQTSSSGNFVLVCRGHRGRGAGALAALGQIADGREERSTGNRDIALGGVHVVHHGLQAAVAGKHIVQQLLKVIILEHLLPG